MLFLNLVFYITKITDPTPAPPLEGRGVPSGVPAAGKAVAIPLPSRGGVRGGVCIVISHVCFRCSKSLLQSYEISERKCKKNHFFLFHC